MSGDKIDILLYLEKNTDIHHIFPESYCKKSHYNERYWNSIVNKTPLFSSTNRFIGGVAPSGYIKALLKEKKIDEKQLDSYLTSHEINVNYLKNDDFHGFIEDRATKLLNLIEDTMGKKITDRDSEEVKKEFLQGL